MMEESLELSLIIPAFNEEQTIGRTLSSLVPFLDTRSTSYEILVVDDGSQDQTCAIVTQYAASQPRVHLLAQPANQGKGRAVQRGVHESHGQIVIFMDADLPYELEALVEMLQALRGKYDLAIGSRRLQRSEIKDVPPLRYLAGQIFSVLVALLMFPGFPDTQCGLKGFKSTAARRIFSHLTIPRFGFDVEALFIAHKYHYAILPVPVKMTGFRQNSRVQVLRDSLRMFLDLFSIRWNDLRGKYA